MGNNTASLVGVAISASLLPPAVNAGLCWVYAILIRCGVIENVKVDPDGNLYDFNVIAGVSFVLTMVNVVCIWVSAVIMFNIKEVAPARSKSAFWSQDIKVARAVQNGSKSSMNLEAVKSGLQYAITKERKEKNMKKKQQKFVILDIEADDPVPLVMKGASTNLYSLEDMTKIVELDQEDLESVDDAPSKRVRRRRYTMEK